MPQFSFRPLLFLALSLGVLTPATSTAAEPTGTSTILFVNGQMQSAALGKTPLRIAGGKILCRSSQDEITVATVSPQATLSFDFQAAGMTCKSIPLTLTLFKTEGSICWHQAFPISLLLPAEGQSERLAVYFRGSKDLEIQMVNAQGKVLSKQLFPISFDLFDKLSLAFEPTAGGTVGVYRVELEEPGFRSLFNGRDLSQWDSSGGSLDGIWSVKDGTIACSGTKGPWLRSKLPYGDFHLKFEYLLNKGGNSGLYVRVPPDGNHHRANDTLPPAGLEIQLLDDADEQYRNLKDYQYSASVYDIVGARPHVSRPAGEWNTFEADVSGQHYRVWHNGVPVIDADANGYPLLNLRQLSGFLGLQNHSSVIQFRNLRIKTR